ncbi:MAG: tRNA uridine-5-carboxymethylaminomethyl(34) synthesis enzyme MnmG [Longibaculum muris]|uniref:tRNA uridine 5-carboxymethylaminomethyl modification enzyme MnmG n=1 Tax=Longibaculum muris TaxID=1796628 RepID=A0A4R3Z0R6_9FIRM|nr:tRNA uridine-5-carboxymethylaminomethyl(34) synthesis enzyme MnmG [Longibaculum muris]KXU40887.1 tRNA uridine 5-carboxymethylaminomethyl modification enzyme GidA [Candidatus Stoquefichus sp. KLE1796]MBS5369323.1 tRNA uridine-5-carboxymethylaminomethyl(34) synthesis enzyme MnmG [Coprobacillus cateniformis]MCR1887975.1 tRNA uridine-5-carboxymethylaminomethyl(34) synthesis enzyme MnmG [Longibaculum muris]MED9812635.1 tRNA uridine-5-carboxymethylaminomethyl(34) synthesis enzyme MnmG [Longibaculu
MYDVIVVGGGHAGIEACLAPARIGKKTLLVTSHFENVGSLPCNTSIGGPAKGIIVREIDALGGQMGKTADATYLQMKMLNTAKGPGVQSLRAQADKKAYPRYMQNILKQQENLDIVEGMVEDLMIEDDTVKGVILDNGEVYGGKTVILTTGTYLKAEILVGDQKTPSGPDQERQSLFLSDKLRELGFRIQRLKTGTPPRVEINSVDYTKTQLQPGTDEPLAFSYETTKFIPIEEQTPCYLTYTNETTHQIIRDNLSKCSMYSGIVKGIGPRYCPSIEDKIVKFSDKPQHQIFLEPESKEMNTIYVQGFSTSMPHDIQEKMIRTIPGLEDCVILKYAYAIEYDAIDPLQLWPSLETKVIKNLFTAGQINGTSGYEEAAAQGLIAGINATKKLDNEDPLVLKRNEAYIGVMIDDLVTKGTKEPYRMLTSRAEYRLLLRHDNADERLRTYGHDAHLVSDEVYQAYLDKMDHIHDEIERLESIRFTPKSEVNDVLEALGSSRLSEGISAKALLQRPEMDYQKLKPFIGETTLTPEEEKRVTILIKYKGYIDKAQRQVEKVKKMEEKQIPSDINYDDVLNLSLEAKQKLSQIKPITIAQASRISGINPADISVLLIYLKQHY